MKHALTYFLHRGYAISIFSKNCLCPLQNITSYDSKTHLWNQIFLIHHKKFFTKVFLPYFARRDAYVMTLPNHLAPKQITNLQTKNKSRNKFLVIAVKNYAEASFRVSYSCPILLDFFT